MGYFDTFLEPVRRVSGTARTLLSGIPRTPAPAGSSVAPAAAAPRQPAAQPKPSAGGGFMAGIATGLPTVSASPRKPQPNFNRAGNGMPPNMAPRQGLASTLLSALRPNAPVGDVTGKMEVNPLALSFAPQAGANIRSGRVFVPAATGAAAPVIAQPPAAPTLVAPAAATAASLLAGQHGTAQRLDAFDLAPVAPVAPAPAATPAPVAAAAPAPKTSARALLGGSTQLKTSGTPMLARTFSPARMRDGTIEESDAGANNAPIDYDAKGIGRTRGGPSTNVSTVFSGGMNERDAGMFNAMVDAGSASMPIKSLASRLLADQQQAQDVNAAGRIAAANTTLLQSRDTGARRRAAELLARNVDQPQARQDALSEADKNRTNALDIAKATADGVAAKAQALADAKNQPKYDIKFDDKSGNIIVTNKATGKPEVTPTDKHPLDRFGNAVTDQDRTAFDDLEQQHADIQSLIATGKKKPSDEYDDGGWFGGATTYGEAQKQFRQKQAELMDGIAKRGGGTGGGTGGAAAQPSPQDQSAIEFVQANPDDPRTPAIIAKLKNRGLM